VWRSVSDSQPLVRSEQNQLAKIRFWPERTRRVDHELSVSSYPPSASASVDSCHGFHGSGL
jgi:hypothetical protein